MKFVISIVVFTAALLAQTAPIQTTLTNPIGSKTAVLQLASTTGISVGNLVFIEREAMTVTDVTGLNVTVFRGAAQTHVTGHAASVGVYAGPAGPGGVFVTVDPTGMCSVPVTAILINLASGNTSACTNGSWITTVYGAASAGGSGVSTVKYIVNYSSSMFASSTSSAAITIAAVPALTSLLGQRVSLVTQFAASGLTSLLCSLGDSSDHFKYSQGRSLDFSLSVTPQSFISDGGFTNSTLAANAVVLYCACSGANCSSLTQGQAEVLLMTQPEPTTSTVVQ